MTPNFFFEVLGFECNIFPVVGRSVGRSVARAKYRMTSNNSVQCHVSTSLLSQSQSTSDGRPPVAYHLKPCLLWSVCFRLLFNCCFVYMVSYQIQLKWTLAHIDCDPQIKGSPLMLAASRTVDHFVQVVCWSLSDGRDRFAFHRMQCWRMPTTNICMLSIWWGEIEMKCSLRFVLHQCQWQCVCYWFN